MHRKTVFISYSHDSAAHREQVLGLSERLREDGLETCLDQYVNGTPDNGWLRWMLDQIDEADFVLVVCTETYYRRFRGHEESQTGKGVDWEGAIITQELYDARSRTPKFVPVLFGPEQQPFVPEPLRSRNYYTLTSDASYEELYDFLLGQAGVEPINVGLPKTRPRRTGPALTFGNSRLGATQQREVPSPGTAATGESPEQVLVMPQAPGQALGLRAAHRLSTLSWRVIELCKQTRMACPLTRTLDV